MSNLFFQKEADPIRKRLQQKNLSVWKGFRLKIKSSEKLSLGEYGRQRTSTKFHDLVKIQRASADKVKIGSLTQNLSILGELIFLTQSAARVQLVLSLRSQNSRVLETIVFLALFSRRKVFNLQNLKVIF